MRNEAIRELQQFVEVIERLRAPGGCPWDRQQTHQSLAPFLLEEAYEALDAIASGDPVALREELGDLLLQVVLHAVIAAESDDGFDIGDVAQTVRTKMVHRHPHVFGDVAVSGADEVVVNWEKLKAREKAGRESLLDGIPAALPALAHAQSVQKRPARVGFDPLPDMASAVAAVRAAVDRVERVTEAPARVAADEGEWVATDGGFARGATVPGDVSAPARSESIESIGELLFAVVALARRLRVDAETALRAHSDGFATHFRRVEAAVKAEGLDPHDLGAEQWRRRWDE